MSIPAPDLDGYHLLEKSGHEQRFYFAEPEGNQTEGLSVTGIGIAAELTTEPLLDDDGRIVSTEENNRFALIRAQVQDLFADSTHLIIPNPQTGNVNAATPEHPARPRLFGGFSFSPEFVPDNTWCVFRPSHFILPHFQLTTRGDEKWLTINAFVPAQESPQAVSADLTEALLTGYEVMRQHDALGNQSTNKREHPQADIHYPMSYDQWSTMVSNGTAAIETGDLQKVVLSRAAEVRMAHSIDAVQVLKRLGNDYANCYRFLFEPLTGQFYLGATPELLTNLEHQSIKTMALAGSARRGSTTQEDELAAHELLESAKNRHEHALVVNEVQSRLAGVCTGITSPSAPSILQLHNIQHLFTPISGQIAHDNKVDALSLVELLHPTPAMGGVPVERAIRFLNNAEPVPRGWYAAPVGWIDQNLNGTFAVAIRSAVCQYDRAWLYAGAGIVGDSQPEREWAETELKFKPMLEAITSQSQNTNEQD
ncbi:MAG: isochorismate synthase [Chloroflexota bacterium]